MKVDYTVSDDDVSSIGELFTLFKSQRIFLCHIKNMMRLSVCKYSVIVRNDYMVTQEI